MPSVRKLVKQLSRIVEATDDAVLTFPLLVLDHGSKPLSVMDAIRKMNEIEKGWTEGKSDESVKDDGLGKQVKTKLTQFKAKDGRTIERELWTGEDYRGVAVVKYLEYIIRRPVAAGFARGM